MAITVQRDPVRVATVHDGAMAPVRFSRLREMALAALRVVGGLMFMQHGVQKHFGLLLSPEQPFSGAPAAFTQMWFAGTLELAGGALLVIGLFTRPVAFLLSGLMASAYFIGHAPRGFWPALNQGELAALYCFIFLAFAAVGGGRYSIDALIRRRRDRQPEVVATGSSPSPSYPNDRRKPRGKNNSPA